MVDNSIEIMKEEDNLRLFDNQEYNSYMKGSMVVIEGKKIS